jgi:rhodanese-related sulfurtransferase
MKSKRVISLIFMGLIVAFAQAALMRGVHAQATEQAAKAVPGKPEVISVPVAYERASKGGVLLFDIREPQEWKGGVAANDKGEQLAKLLPMSALKTRLGEIPNDPNQPVILICRTQNRSGAVAEQLSKLGYTNITYVNGGMKEWGERKLPTVVPQ